MPKHMPSPHTHQHSSREPQAPLAQRMRPKVLSDFVGQRHIVGSDTLLSSALHSDDMHSCIFWGPPGTGKTTLAELISRHVQAYFIPLSAVDAGVKDIRKAMEYAQHQRTLVFVDEVHRFNKAQQDAFLPAIEAGDIIFIGATTENPALSPVSASSCL